jgi:putative thioredoxin
MPSEYIVTVTESSFEYDVVAYSQNTPVIVDFWADWCKPCKLLTPMLERMAEEAEGGFRLATVDVDANPNLALRFSVRSIPTVMAFSQGKKVSDFTGLIPEPRIIEFLENILPPKPSDLLAQKGNSLLAMENINGARKAFLEGLDLDERHPACMLGLMKVQLLEGNSDEAQATFRSFPASYEFNEAERLIPLIKAMEDYRNNLLPGETDLDAAFINSVRLASRGNTLASIDGLLEILRQDKHYRKDRARGVLLALLELRDQNADLTRQYRAELASILF